MEAAAESQMGPLALSTLRKYTQGSQGEGGHKTETWEDVAYRQAYSVVRPYLPDMEEKTRRFIVQRKMIPGGRYLYAAGRRYPQVNNCFLFKAEDSRDGPGGWANTSYNVVNSLMTGGGIGVVYSSLRGENYDIRGLGGKSTGPLALMRIVNESGRYIIQGGSRRSAIWAGLHWWHPDIFKFIHMKDVSPEERYCKKRNFNFPIGMEGTNISVILDDDFFTAYYDSAWTRSYKLGDQWHTVNHNWARRVFHDAVRRMLETGEPGFSVDVGENEGENLRNACTEAVSRDNLDMCNLLSINLARISSLPEFMDVMEAGVAFLECGTLYSKLPVPEMYGVREKNRRLGLGLMGIHEWLLQRGRRYGRDDELGKWLDAYSMSGALANRVCDKLGISRSVATRSLAPTGTIAMLAETTSAIDPLPAVTYERRYLVGNQWMAQVVVAPIAQRLIAQGVDPMLIEDSYTLAEDVDRRLGFQAWVQERVDQGISSTVNLPDWGSSVNNEGTVESFKAKMLRYLPNLRGVTVYPNGARDGQPIVRMDYYEAIRRGIGKEYNAQTKPSDNQAHHNGEAGITANMDNPANAIDILDNASVPQEDSLYQCRNGTCGD
jgi:ribonucleoside-diphosphate reductase alpha chain